MPAALQGSLVGRWYPEPLSSIKPLSPLPLESMPIRTLAWPGCKCRSRAADGQWAETQHTHEPTTSQGTLTNTKPTHQYQRQRQRQHHQHRDGCRDSARRSSMSLNWGMESPLSRGFILGSTEYLAGSCKVLSPYHPISSCQLVSLSCLASSLLFSSCLVLSKSQPAHCFRWVFGGRAMAETSSVRDRCNATCRSDPAV